ncbi:hypothetical protein [Halosimplex salinum]|uniref:hypothetical protein n=1 Tax=Halosimplex salinum TaxID=1710538 RepID=UPI0013DD91B0|nr:hypothetical protein [Halosimplex salinum]
MNRRNVLIGIGTAAVGSGAALGSGALTQVEASRSLSITTQGDGSAFLELNGQSSFVTTTSGANGEDIIQIDLGKLNDQAVTTLSPAFQIVNSFGEGVGVTVNAGSGVSGVTLSANGSTDDITTVPQNNGDVNNLADTESFQVDVEVDSTGTVSGGDITIVADTGAFVAP